MSKGVHDSSTYLSDPCESSPTSIMAATRVESVVALLEAD
jgi:hypothetical protein